MNVRRFTARTSRDALVLVRQVLGEDAVVLSTKPSVDGVEVLAMAPDGMQQIERMAEKAPSTSAAASNPSGSIQSGKSLAARVAARAEPSLGDHTEIDADVARLSMSTLSFQDYVRERMLRRRRAAMKPEAKVTVREERPMLPPAVVEHAGMLEQRMSERAPAASAPVHREPQRAAPVAHREMDIPALADHPGTHQQAHQPMHQPVQRAASNAPAHGLPPVANGNANNAANNAANVAAQAAAAGIASATARRDQEDMMSELRSMKGLIEERFGALAFLEKLNRQPGQARLTQKLLDCGYSPALIRKIGDSLPMDVADESAWAASVLERNLSTAEAEAPLEDQGGVYALVGATGVGKTTTTAKIAAAFATKYGASNLGLITLDAYRIGAHEQLRAYGRILGVPVHTAHDRASLEDLLELLSAKKMVLIDTAGMAQRDTRTQELMEMLSHRSIRKLLVINSASQGETIEDVMVAYQATACAGVVLSKMDEAVKLGPAIDALIRLKLKVIGVANGQRVPEDWHRLSANALVHRSLRGGGSAAYKLDASDVSLIFTAQHNAPRATAQAARQPLHN